MDEMFVNSPSISISGSVDGGEVEAQMRPLCMIEGTEGTIGSSSQTCNVSKPYIGMKFNSHEEAYDFYNAYGCLTGFGIRKSSTNYSRKTKKVLLDKKFVCNKEGHKSINDKRNEGKVVNHRRETRVGCIAMMQIKLLEDGRWEVNSFVEEHTNHELSSPDKVKMHRSQKQFHRSEAIKQSIGSMFDNGIRPSTISRVINATSGKNDEIVTPQQCNDYIRTLRKNNIGQECISIIRHFLSKAAHDPDFYFAVEVDSTGQMRSVFWADGRSREAYLKFSDVVFDVTYKTNKFRLPFAPFTGVNHHRQSTLFGCALLADEQEDTFVWLFQEWLKCMHGVEPGAIITDQDRAMCNAIHVVLPNSRHRYCYWHLQNHISDHLPHLHILYGEQFQNYYDNWYYSSTIEQCDVHWAEMKEKFGINESNNDWLQHMYKYRDHWVACYLKNIFFAGMKSSQRSESINAFFDGYINAQTQLSLFVSQYDKAVADRRATEARGDFMTLNTKPILHLSHPIEIQVGSIYTRSIFNIFQNELKSYGNLFREELKEEKYVIYRFGTLSEDRRKWETIVQDETRELEFSCSCALFENNGILCKHLLHVMLNNQLHILSYHYILHRWTIHSRHRNIGVDNILMGRSNISSKEQINLPKYWALRAKFNNALDMLFKSSNSTARMQKLDNILSDFMKEDEKVVECNQIQGGESIGRAGPDTQISQTIEHIPQITVRDPDRPIRTRGRPPKVSRWHSGKEQAQENSKKQKRSCRRCGQRGHYKTSCVNPPASHNVD